MIFSRWQDVKIDTRTVAVCSVALVISLILYNLVIALYSVLRPGLRHIPGPFLAKFSSFWNVRNNLSGNAPLNYQELHKKYGKIVRTGPNVVDISDPTVIPVIYGISSNFIKSDFYTTFEVLDQGRSVSNMFSVIDNAEHKRLKSSIASKYSVSSLRDMEPLLDECNVIFMEAMRDLEGTKVELATWLQWYAFDVIGKITFFERFGFMEQRKDIKGMIAGLDDGLKYGAVIGQVPAVHPYILGSPFFTWIVDSIPALADGNPIPKFNKFTRNAMRKCDLTSEKSGLERQDFLAYCRKFQAKHPERMSDKDILNHLMTNVLAGSDTTAITLRATLYYIIKTPRVYQKLLDEIEAAEKEGLLPDPDKVTFDECQKLTYLQAVIKEALRIHPGVGLPLERVVPPEGARLCDFNLPGGTIVGVNAWVVHQDTYLYGADSAIFRPERWLEASADQLKLMDKYFLSFGYGARTCIGKNLSIIEMGKLVPQILRKFDLEWASEKEEWTVKTFWFTKQSDMFVRFKSKSRQ